MNILWLVGLLILLIVLGYPYLILVLAGREKGIVRLLGQALSGLLVLTLLALIILSVSGLVQVGGFGLMPERPTTRMMRGMSGYLSGMMTEDEKAIDEFISVLKSKPELYQKFKEKLKQ